MPISLWAAFSLYPAISVANASCDVQCEQGVFEDAPVKAMVVSEDTMTRTPSALPNPRIVDSRFLTMLQDNVDSPWPGIDNPDSSAGNFSYALACLYLDTNVADANQRLITYYTRNPIPDNESTDGYFWNQIMWRIYHDPAMRDRLIPEARTIIENNMWRWVHHRSHLAHANQSEWIIHNSENHDAMEKGANLLCLLALKNVPEYGPDRQLADGGTITEHIDAWTQFYLRYFRSRAMEGINVEIACPQYAKYTVGTYYNIMDFSDSAELRALVKTFIDLYWADTASDWTLSGVRGGSQTRVYKNNYLKRGTQYSFHALLYGYGWHDNPGTVSTYSMIPAVSTYRVPDIITDCATDPNRPNFLYTSRRFGRGGGWVNKDYTVVFDNGDSNLRRDSWATPDYTMGTFAVDMNRDYIALIDQNRAMGVTFASDANDRVMVFGKGGSDPSKSFADISGITQANCMVIQRDPNAYSDGDASMVYVSSTLWDNRVETGGWFFTQSGAGYCAIKPASGGYSATSTSYGYYLEMDDQWAPVVIQMGQAANYPSFASFRESVLANPISYSANTMTYTSEAGDVFTVYANSRNTPQVNGTTVNLNPAKTYDSPYLSMVHGESIATVSYGAYPDLILDFGADPAAPPPPPDDLNDWNAPQAAVIPNIDGSLDLGEWGDAFKLVLQYPQITQFPNVGGYKYEAPSWADLSANVFYKWDANYLYVAFQITDDALVPPEPGTGYPDDHILFGFNPDINNTSWDNTLSVNLFLNSLGNPDASTLKNGAGTLLLDNSVFAAAPDSSGWSLEARLKWTEIVNDTSYVPAIGDTFGTALLLIDNDADDGTRDTFLFSAGEGDDGVMTKPGLWHEATLSGAQNTYEYWIRQHEDLESMAELADDPDGDRLDNLGEYLFGGNPVIKDAAEIMPSFIHDASNDLFNYTYRRRIGAQALGFDYTVQATDTLSPAAWSSDGITQTKRIIKSNEIEAVTVSMPASPPSQFVRVAVTETISE